jgi:hypothetical protein
MYDQARDDFKKAIEWNRSVGCTALLGAQHCCAYAFLRVRASASLAPLACRHVAHCIGPHIQIMILPEAPSVIQEVKLQLSALNKLEERAALLLVRLYARIFAC